MDIRLEIDTPRFSEFHRNTTNRALSAGNRSRVSQQTQNLAPQILNTLVNWAPKMNEIQFETALLEDVRKNARK
jgi:hypothetical protein